MKVITLCGSLKFKDEMMKKAIDLEFQGNCVLPVIFPLTDDKDAFSKEELEKLRDAHKKRIEISDAIYVVNVGGYIGESTTKEIEYAKSLGKEILYLENVN